MILDLDDPRVGAYLVDAEELRRINAESFKYGWGARWSDEARLMNAIDQSARHVIVPLLKNGGKPDSFRCYLWYLLPRSNERMCALVDVSADLLDTLQRMDRRELEALVAMLFSGLDISPTE
ncbi:hypothetical protein [Micromonospora schwarzwaldensis]|uniref:hypothetical protein n=1 Tax=Micromonospora sp. DSM 45708 TaxID=3111767 RepID=UPI0031DE5056